MGAQEGRNVLLSLAAGAGGAGGAFRHDEGFEVRVEIGDGGERREEGDGV